MMVGYRYMVKWVIDSSVFSYYVAGEIVKDRLVCELKKEELYTCVDSEGEKKEIPKPLLELLEKKILKPLNPYVIKSDKKIIIQLSPEGKRRLRKIKEEIEKACRKECYVTPDLGVSVGKTIMNPYALRVTGNPVYATDDIWNKTIKEVLEKLNAKILIDKDFEKIIGSKGYNNLYEFWNKFTGGRVYTDPEDKITPIVHVKYEKEIDNKKFKGEVTVIYDKEVIVRTNRTYRLDKEMLEKHVSARKMMEALANVEEAITEFSEAEKRVVTSEIEKGKVKKYYGIEGSIDFYLRAISRDDDVRILTTDKDLYQKITVISEPNKKNIILL